MARRARYVVSGNMSFNDVKAKGQTVVFLGKCNSGGSTKTSAGKPIPRKQATHHLFRFEDKKWVKDNKLANLSEFSIADEHLGMFVTFEG
jgi:hypothetical protein